MPDRVATLSQSFEAQAQKYGARAFLKDKRDKVWTDHSWTEVSEAAGKLRAGLLGLGVRPGDRVAILSDNCPEWIVVDQAVLGLGAIVVPLYTTSGLEETAHVISDSGAKVDRGQRSRDGQENSRPRRLDSRRHRDCRDASLVLSPRPPPTARPPS